MKIAVITGASRGIGLAAAEKFLSEGWRVVATARGGKLPIENENLSVVVLDYEKAGSIAKAAGEIRRLAPEIRVVVNNSGVLVDHGKSEIRMDALRETLEVNLFGAVEFTNAILPLVAKGGHVINISSNLATLGGPVPEAGGWLVPEYRISKAALNMFTKVLAARAAKSGIAVSSLDPGWVRTEMGGAEATRAPEEAAEDIYNLAIKKVPTGKFWSRGKERGW
ncbi:MAG: SDR family NAD(P)-dependent oxidoreductase [Patescibacteria group bacterium]|nr:SDR family NAD(P)-dependent oxidoreductase [Patescibacteria group bacterium]